MFKIFLFVFYSNFILCNNNITEDNELIKIKNNNDFTDMKKTELEIFNFFNFLKYFISKFFLKSIPIINQNSSFFFKESYRNAFYHILPYTENFLNSDLMNSDLNINPQKNIDEKNGDKYFLEMLFQNLNSNSTYKDDFKKIFDNNYFIKYSNLIKSLVDLNKKEKGFNALFNIDDSEDNIVIGFYKIATLLIKNTPDLCLENVFLIKFNELIELFKKNIKKVKSKNIYEMMQNNIEIYLVSPYFILYYITYSFVNEHFNKILNFINNIEKLKVYRENFYLESQSNISGNLVFIYNYKNIKIQLFFNKEIYQKNNQISIVDLKILNIDKEIIPKVLITKQKLKEIFFFDK